MDLNITNFNTSLVQILNLVNLNVNVTNETNSDVPVMDLFEEYRMREKNKLFVYKIIAYIVGVCIIISNLSVVVSSGLILKKGQKPKSTYILLGNVSLADTIVGISIIYRLSLDNRLISDTLCIIQMGLLVCPAMVSIFSVGLIAVDRYIYILHGLYYQRWFNTTRVRIGIMLIWSISITLGFMPATGWVNKALLNTRCYYVELFPGTLVLLNSVLSIIPIVVVAVLYTFILITALKTVKTINRSIKVRDIAPETEAPTLRLNRRTVNIKSSNEMTPPEKYHCTIKRSVSFDLGTGFKAEHKHRSKSIENISDDKRNETKSNFGREFAYSLNTNNDKQGETEFNSEFSVCTVESSTSHRSLSIESNNRPAQSLNSVEASTNIRKVKEPNKWRAITVVILTSGSLILTWIPFFVTVIFYVFCEEKQTNPRCIRIQALLGGPLAILAFLNSIFNPLIYAWWHKDFKKSVKTYYKRYFYKYVCHVAR